MTKPIFSLPVPQPGQTTKKLLDTETNRVLTLLYAAVVGGGDQAAIDAVTNQIGEILDQTLAAAGDAGVFSQIAAAFAASAEAARDAAVLNVGLFTSAAAGVDPVNGVASGEQFYVVEVDEYVRYLNDDGVAEEVLGARLTTANGVRTIQDIAVNAQPAAITRLRSAFDEPDIAFALTDDDDQPVIAVDGDGFRVEQSVKILRRSFEHPTPARAILSGDGKLLLGWDGDGSTTNSGGLANLAALTDTIENLPSGDPYASDRRIAIQRDFGEGYTGTPTSLFSNAAELNGHFDALMAEYPAYITRTQIGQDSLGSPLWQYVFEPPNLADNNDRSRFPPMQTLVIFNAIHGTERRGGVPVVLLAQEMCQRWREDLFLRHLRWETRIVFIPCLSPSGTDANIRQNSNGVDLNRNFPTNFGLPDPPTSGSTNPASTFYQGEAPADQLETQAAIAVINAEGLTAAGVISCHNHTTLAERGRVIWVAGDTEDDRDVLGYAMREHAAWLRQEMAHLQDYPDALNEVTRCISGSLEKHATALGARGVLFESCTGHGGTSLQTTQANVEGLRRVIAALLNNRRD